MYELLIDLHSFALQSAKQNLFTDKHLANVAMFLSFIFGSKYFLELCSTRNDKGKLLSAFFNMIVSTTMFVLSILVAVGSIILELSN